MLEGKNILLRAIEEQDLEQLMHWRNNPNMRKFFRETDEINMYKQKKWFEMINMPNSKHKMFTIVDKQSHILLGVCGLCYIDTVNKSADFSIYIGHNELYIDDVYATDASVVMRDYAFNILNLHRLWAEIYTIDNQKKELFRKLNFQLDGEFRETYWYNGKWHNSLFYSALSSDAR